MRASWVGRFTAGMVAACLTTVGGGEAEAQLRPSYDEGQWVSPAYEGWVENEDGSIDILFGYMNRNWLEVVEAPIGPDNHFVGAEEDLGQPTVFFPRRNRFVFKVRAPEGMTQEEELIWELTTNGVTQRAYATLRPDFRLDNVAMMSETGALGAGTSTPEIRANEAPVIELEGEVERNVRVGETVTLVATVTDDGVPEQDRSVLGPPEGATPEQLLQRALTTIPRITVAKDISLHLTWFPYRGGNEVTFDPPQVKPWEDTRQFQNSPWSPFWIAPPIPEDGVWTTDVTFHEPGTYVLRGRADDGGLLDDVEVTFHVNPMLP